MVHYPTASAHANVRSIEIRNLMPLWNLMPLSRWGECLDQCSTFCLKDEGQASAPSAVESLLKCFIILIHIPRRVTSPLDPIAHTFL